MNYGNPDTFAKPEHAKAKAFFERMKLDNLDQAKMLVRVGDDGLSVEEAVQEWKDSSNDWQAWLP